MLKKPIRPFMLSLLRAMFPNKASVIVFVCIVIPAYILIVLFLSHLDR